MVLIGLGANLPSAFGPPVASVKEAIRRLSAEGRIRASAVSQLYATEAVPASDQPDFVNAVAEIETDLSPEELLERLQDIERDFGRVRFERWEARPLDLDILDFNGIILRQAGLELPHPRMHERRFVLVPLLDVAPKWRHPKTGKSIGALLEEAPVQGEIRPV